jgi:uncharacterized damage-inducible protein DinB
MNNVKPNAAADRGLVVASLEATPRLLRLLTADATAAQAATPPAPGEWSIAEVVRHLVEGDRDTFVPRLRLMLAEARPVFASRRPEPGDASDVATLLDVFAKARGQAVGQLAALDDPGWRREGVSPSRGALSVETYARTMAAHDTEHLQQIHAGRVVLGLLPRRCEARLPLAVPELVAALRAAPARVAEFARGLDAERLRRRPTEGKWSMREVMAHLRDLERDLFLPRLRRILEEERPRFESFDPEAWARSRDHREGSFEADLEEFIAARARTLAFLEALPDSAVARVGLSGHFGPVTLAQYATHVADHDLEHLGQLMALRGEPVRPASRAFQ